MMISAITLMKWRDTIRLWRTLRKLLEKGNRNFLEHAGMDVWRVVTARHAIRRAEEERAADHKAERDLVRALCHWREWVAERGVRREVQSLQMRVVGWRTAHRKLGLGLAKWVEGSKSRSIRRVQVMMGLGMYENRLLRMMWVAWRCYAKFRRRAEMFYNHGRNSYFTSRRHRGLCALKDLISRKRNWFLMVGAALRRWKYTLQMKVWAAWKVSKQMIVAH